MTTLTMDKKSAFTPFNIVAGIIMIIGVSFAVQRLLMGLGSVTNLTDNNPFGIWIAFDVMSGVALAAGGYMLSSMVYIFGLDEYHPVVRPAILTAFLGYFFVGLAVAFDVGRPWRLPYPFLVSHGTTSVMFEVACCVALYLTTLMVEFMPAAMEWLGKRRQREILVRMTIGLTIFGVMLSTMHQSSLGAMFLIAKTKVHPLWYSPFLPVLFFVSSMSAGLSMVILESSISHKVFHDQINKGKPFNHDKIVLGLAKAASFVLLAYFALKVIVVWHENQWAYLPTKYGAWFLVEILGFVLLPSALFFKAQKTRNVVLAKRTSAIAVAGILLNRFNVCIVAFNWKLPMADRYIPSFQEIMITLMFVTTLILIFRWIVLRMPVLYDHPDYADGH